MKPNCIILIFFFYVHNVTLVFSLTCKRILEQPEGSRLSLQELKTVPPEDLIECLAHVSKERLEDQEASYIWQTIVNYYGGIKEIPESVLILLHWVTPAISPEEYANLTFNTIDIVSNFGLDYNLNDEQLAAIAHRVREDFAGKEPEDYTYYDLTALRQILCAFNRSEIERIRPSVYKESAHIIGKLQHCNSEVLSGFARLAVQKTAFGHPQTWSESTVKIMGVIADNFPKYVQKSYISTPKP